MVYVLFALSTVLSAGYSALYGWYESWSVLWKLPLLCVGCFVAMVLLFLLVLVVSCLFVDPKKPLETAEAVFQVPSQPVFQTCL